MPERSKSSKSYTARAEFVAVAFDVVQQRRAGRSVVAIHTDLSDRSKITMPYRTFVRWLKRMEQGTLGFPDVPIGAMHKHVAASRDQGALEQSGLKSKAMPQGGPTQPPQRQPESARLGVPILPAPNSEPDCHALFGDEE